MNKFGSLNKPLTWFMALLLAAVVAGCGGGGGVGGGVGASSGAAVLPGAAGTPGAAATDPTVGSASPSNSATNVPTSTNSPGNVVTGTLVTANFTQAMDPTTINSSPAGTLLTFTLKETTGANVPGTVAMNGANTAATFTPTAALLPNTSYTATVTTAAKSAGGIAMASPIEWSFTTAAVATIGQAPVDLLSVLTNNFVILTETGITNTGSHLSVITGNIGASPITAAAMNNVFCTEITGIIYGVDAGYTGSGATTCFAGNPGVPAVLPPDANKTLVDNAVADRQTAYNAAAGRTGPDFTELGAGDISGMTLAPGLYKWSSGLLIDLTGVTLSGSADDVWIFQIAADLTVNNAAIVNLIGGAQAKNVFWQVGGLTGVAIGTTAQFKGIILAEKAITMATGSSVIGRLLSKTSVTLDATTVTQPAP